MPPAPRWNRVARNRENSQEQGEFPASSGGARERDRRNPWLPQAAPGLDRLLARNSNSAHRRDPPTPGQSWDPTSLPLDMTESHPPRWTYQTASQLQMRDHADRHRKRRDCSSASPPAAPFLAGSALRPEPQQSPSPTHPAT